MLRTSYTLLYPTYRDHIINIKENVTFRLLRKINRSLNVNQRLNVAIFRNTACILMQLHLQYIEWYY